MRTLFIIVFICLTGIFLCVPVLHAQQIDTTVYHQLKGVEVVEKARPSTTREATPFERWTPPGERTAPPPRTEGSMLGSSAAPATEYGGREREGRRFGPGRRGGSTTYGCRYDGVTITDAQSGQVDISRFSLDNVGDDLTVDRAIG